ncbi:MAG: carboxylesterase/lipase family protein [Deltaproteobacteria bacterium]|nr:carboxylesterase/lipase family protein [Deltaproteobacteria bacterium]
MTLVVETRSGTVRGIERDGVAVWRGIPYAEPPLGPLRFLPPRPPLAWTGERDATRFGAVAMQSRDPRIAIMSGIGEKIAMSEDCLVLNVFAPFTHADGPKRPVLVWIHGGAFVMGSGSTPLYHGTSFAQHDVVVMTLNYRLGLFGFLYLGDQSPAHREGNVGLLDQVAALRWVQHNIAGFGGDPDRVTVMGESAGAVSVATLLAMPAAAGLFHAAILQSGAAGLLTPTCAQATALTHTILDDLGTRDLDVLATLPAEQLLDAQHRASALRGIAAFAPYVDGFTLPRAPIEAVRDGAAIKVPLLLGSNRDEWTLFEVFMGDASTQVVKSLLRAQLGEDVDRIHAGYVQADEATSSARAWVDVIGDAAFRIPMIHLAEAQAGHAAVWMYRFDWASSGGGGRLGATHALELPFVWNRLELPASQFLLGGELDRARPLAAQMHATWIAFVTRGQPDGGGLPAWPAYDSTRRATMLLDETSRVVDDPGGVLRALWDAVT